MSKNYKSRKQQFAINIRKEHVQAFKKQKRKSFYTSSYEIVIGQIIKQFQIDDSQNKIIIQQKSQTLLKILQLKFQSLVKTNFKEFTMFDQKQTTQNSQIQFQKVLLPKQYHVRFHVAFYELLINDLFSNANSYKQKKILQQFVKKFIQRNKYKEIAAYNNYQIKIINLFELIMADSKDQDLKKSVLHWVEGTESINLIFNCLPTYQFLFIQGYRNVYMIIQLGLNLPVLQKNQQTLDILLKILRQADFDDITTLLGQQIGILINLLQLTFKNLGTPIINKCAKCIMLMLQTYDTHLYQMATVGVGLIAAKLIVSQIQQQVKNGLKILTLLTVSQEKILHGFLLRDQQINQSGVWNVMGKSQKILKNSNTQIRRLFNTLIFNIISNGGQEELILLEEKINYQNKEDLLDILINTVYEEESPITILNALSNIKTLLFYSDQVGEDSQQKNDELFDRIMNSKLQVRITELSKSQNSTLKTDCQEFLLYIQRKAEQKNSE